MDNFYNYPLLIKQLLISPLLSNPNKKIINDKNISYDYKTFNNRVSILSNSLTHIGVKKGDTIGVMDWDTTRYLECFFAIPMMGAILHTINIRLSEQQILYTINHADDDFLLINEDFLPTLNKIKEGFERDIKILYHRNYWKSKRSFLQPPSVSYSYSWFHSWIVFVKL